MKLFKKVTIGLLVLIAPIVSSYAAHQAVAVPKNEVNSFNRLVDWFGQLGKEQRPVDYLPEEESKMDMEAQGCDVSNDRMRQGDRWANEFTKRVMSLPVELQRKIGSFVESPGFGPYGTFEAYNRDFKFKSILLHHSKPLAVTLSYDGFLKVFNVGTKQVVYAINILADGQMKESMESCFQELNSVRGVCVRDYHDLSQNEARLVGFSNDGNLIALHSHEVVFLLNVSENRCEHVFRVTGFQRYCNADEIAFRFSPDLRSCVWFEDSLERHVVVRINPENNITHTDQVLPGRNKLMGFDAEGRLWAIAEIEGYFTVYKLYDVFALLDSNDENYLDIHGKLVDDMLNATMTIDGKYCVYIEHPELNLDIARNGDGFEAKDCSLVIHNLITGTMREINLNDHLDEEEALIVRPRYFVNSVVIDPYVVVWFAHDVAEEYGPMALGFMVIDIESGVCKKKIRLADEDDKPFSDPYNANYFMNDRFFIADVGDSRVNVWDLISGKKIQTINGANGHENLKANGNVIVINHGNKLSTYVVRPAGGTFAIAVEKVDFEQWFKRDRLKNTISGIKTLNEKTNVLASLFNKLKHCENNTPEGKDVYKQQRKCLEDVWNQVCQKRVKDIGAEILEKTALCFDPAQCSLGEIQALREQINEYRYLSRNEDAYKHLLEQIRYELQQRKRRNAVREH